MNLKALAKKRFKVTTDSDHSKPGFDNVLNRDFITTAINQKWARDISYIHTEEGWIYLAVVIDLHSRAVIGCSMSKAMKTQLICDALMMALFKRKFLQKVIVHFDRGSQYCSSHYQQMIKNYKLIGSMSRKGNCWDNAIISATPAFADTSVACTNTDPADTNALNAAITAGGTVTITGTCNLPNGITINNTITLNGQGGATLTGGQNSSNSALVFITSPAISVSMNNLILNAADGGFGAVFSIWQDTGTLSINNSYLINNTSQGNGILADINAVSLTVANSTIVTTQGKRI